MTLTNPTIRASALALMLLIMSAGCAVAPDGLVRGLDQGAVVTDIADADDSDDTDERIDAQAETLGSDTDEGSDVDAQAADVKTLVDTFVAEDVVADPGVLDVGVDVGVDAIQDVSEIQDQGADVSELDTSSPPQDPLSCCFANGGIGCSDSSCADLVCVVDFYCCFLEWDKTCAATASTVCGGCNLAGSGACCVNNGSPKCEDFDCMNTVCQQDPHCCNVEWDGLCANKAGDLCNECDMSDAGDCCTSNGDPYCEKLSCVQAVCEKDDYCCTGKWDTFCANCAGGGATYDGIPCGDIADVCGCAVSHQEIAEHWAPVWYQDTDDTDAQADYITAFDFDGDTISQNNWENLHTEAADLSAVIYWSLVETETHWFVLYADFHPRDWTEDCDPLVPFLSSPCHENDMEGAMVVIRKDGSEWGQFQVLYTEAHNALHIFTNDSGITAGSSPNLESAAVSFEDGSHPELYVESKGHGVCALLFDGDSHCEHPVTPGENYFPGGDGIVYRFKGVAEVPSGGNDQDVGYALVPLESTLWTHRFNICDDGCTFDGNLNYMGVNFGKAFDGETWKDDAANPPWAWDDPEDGDLVQRGDFFFRPAHTFLQHVQGQGEVSQVYLYNPYFSSIPGIDPL